MKRIRIKYLDWWEGFNPEDYKIHNILSKHYEIEQSENPDYVFCSLFSKEALKYNAVRILYSGENFCPDFNLFDYAIGFDYLIFGDRYIRYPNYLFNIKYSQETNMMLNKHTISDELFSNKTDFCSFVVSNGNADPIRDLFFDKLSEYKRVNSGGKYRNNIGIPQGVENKYEFQKKHKFVIAFENSSQPGYTTEKLIQAFSAGSIPIYW